MIGNALALLPVRSRSALVRAIIFVMGANCSVLAGTAHAQISASAKDSIPAVSLPNTQLRHLHSRSAGTAYQIRVRTPDSYGTSDRRYPVLYLLDGDLLFGLASDIVRYLEWGRLSPELII